MVSIRLSPTARERLLALAAEAGVTRSAYVEALIVGEVRESEPESADERREVKPKPRAVPAAPAHEHRWSKQVGTSGLTVWTCPCGERATTNPVNATQ